jgi:hypothetical protein
MRCEGFTTAAVFGAHRQKVHGVAGTSEAAKYRQRTATGGTGTTADVPIARGNSARRSRSVQKVRAWCEGQAQQIKEGEAGLQEALKAARQRSGEWTRTRRSLLRMYFLDTPV